MVGLTTPATVPTDILQGRLRPALCFSQRRQPVSEATADRADRTARARAEVDRLRQECLTIETQLEFDDDTRDPTWRPRAIDALAHRRRDLKEAERQLRRAIGHHATEADQVAAATAKAEAKLAGRVNHAAAAMAAAERRRKERLDLAARLSFALAFQRCARQQLDPAIYAAVLDAAAQEVATPEAEEAAIAQREDTQ